MKEHFNFELQNFNTFHIKSCASHVFIPENIEEMIELCESSAPFLIISNASNILFSSLGVNETLVFTRFLDKISIENDILNVECGAKSPVLARFAQSHELTGFEFLYPIPSLVGGNIFMNAGANEQTISDNLISVQAFDFKCNKVVELKRDMLNFSYRSSFFKENAGRYAILSAKFKAIKGNAAQIEEKMQTNLLMRKKTQPDMKLPNAGSIFKNPENAHAGALLDKCNLKGVKVGGASVYAHHANFIVNNGSATSDDILNLMLKMQNEVYNKFKVRLEPEIIFIGKKTGIEDKIWTKMQK